MSIQSEITRISGAKSDIADAIETKGVTVPSGSMIDDMADLILQIDDSPDLQAKTGIDPTESSQTITADAGYYGLSSVQIDAIDSEYVGSDIPRNDSSDLTVSGATVSVPAGYYEESASKSVASGSATTPETEIPTAMTINVNSLTGLITVTANGSSSITPTVIPGYIASGSSGNVTVYKTGTHQLSTIEATVYNTSSSDQTITNGKYIIGTQTIKGVKTANITSGNIKSGVTALVGDTNNLKRILEVAGTFTSSSTVSSGQIAASSSEILSGYSAWVDGTEVIGSMTGDRAMTAAEILTAVQAGWI